MFGSHNGKVERLYSRMRAHTPILTQWTHMQGRAIASGLHLRALLSTAAAGAGVLLWVASPSHAGQWHTLRLSPNALWRRTGGSHGWMAMDSVYRCIYAAYMIFTCCVFSELISQKWFKTASLESFNWEWLFGAPESCGVPPLFLKLQPAPGPCQAQRCTSRAWCV